MILLAIWSLANLLHVTIASIIILVKLLIILLSFYHLVQINKNQDSYPNFHHITMDKQPKLVIKCKNFITTQGNILNNPYNNYGYSHHFLMHELNHCPSKVFITMFLVNLGTTKKSYKGLNASYSNIGHPCYNKCKMWQIVLLHLQLG
jgi:hypothetical protein